MSKKDHVNNPATGWFTWRPSEGNLGYWDKTAQQKKTANLPVVVKVVHVAYTLKGWNPGSKVSYFSNEFYDFSRNKISVIKKNETTGKFSFEYSYRLYADIKEALKNIGVRLVVRLYCISKSTHITCIEVSGQSLVEWFAYSKKNKDYDQAIELSSVANETDNFTLTFKNVPNLDSGLTVDDARAKLSEYVNWYLRQQLAKEKEYNNGEYVDPRQVQVADDLKELAKSKPVVSSADWQLDQSEVASKPASVVKESVQKVDYPLPVTDLDYQPDEVQDDLPF